MHAHPRCVLEGTDQPDDVADLKLAVSEVATERLAVSAEPATSAVPLLADRAMIDGRPTAYLCRDFACRLPVTSADALLAQLDDATRGA